MTISVTTYLPGREVESVADDVWKLLCLMDEQFIPALSQRKSVTTSKLQPEVLSTESLLGGPVSYFESLMSQEVGLAHIDGAVVGIVSWADGFTDKLLAPEFASSFRITTIATHSDHTQQGVATAMVQTVRKRARWSSAKWIVARHASGTASTPMFLRNGFKEIARVIDDRGEGIDTVYFGMRNEKS